MKLYDLSRFIRTKGVFIAGALLIVYISVEVIPDILFQANIEPQISIATTPTEPLVRKIDPPVFTPTTTLQIAPDKIDLSNANITFLLDPNFEFSKYSTIRFPVYDLVTVKNAPLDYSETASTIAYFLGYNDEDQIAKGDVTNDYSWTKNQVTFSINKKNLDMTQVIPNGNIVAFKSIFTAGEFTDTNYTRNQALEMLRASRRFNSNELSSLFFNTDYLRFEGDTLVPANQVNAELAYTKVYKNLNGYRVVGRLYEIPNTYFFIGSLRFQLRQNFKNYLYPTFRIIKNDYLTSRVGDTYTLKPMSEAVSEIVNFKNFVVSSLKYDAAAFGTPLPQTNSIRSITLDSYEIGYFDDFDTGIVNNKLIQPIYIFKGRFQNFNGNTGTITIYTRAIENRFYNL